MFYIRVATFIGNDFSGLPGFFSLTIIKGR